MILFLKVFGLGIDGYMLAVTLADAVSAIFLTIPTIPAAISWWIMEMSDKFMITAIISVAANGIYSVAAEIPSIVAIISGVFINAWQISIIKTRDKQEQSRFYSNIMLAYEAVLFLMAGVG